MTNTPTKAGFYWARWIIPAPGTADNGDPCSGEAATWEPVEVWENTLDADHPEHLRAHVFGVAQGQPLENFQWGVEIVPPREYR
jgi:hypothetical protein